MFAQSFFHGTRANLKPGDLIVVGHRSNFTDVKPLSCIYFAATPDAAIWAPSWPRAPHQDAAKPNDSIRRRDQCATGWQHRSLHAACIDSLRRPLNV